MSVHAKLAAVMKDITAISKAQDNKQQGFKYRGIDDVYNALNPLMAKHGLFMTSHVLDKTREERPSQRGGVLAFTCLRMQYTFWADDGTSVSTVVEGEGMDSGDKSSNKAMAVAHKYALLQTFCIPTKDLDDPDAESPEIAGKKPDTKPDKPPPAPNPALQIGKKFADELKKCTTLDELDLVWETVKSAEDYHKTLNDPLRNRLQDVYLTQVAELTPKG